MFRFQGQTDLNDSKPSDLWSAIEEAFLAENGFTEMLMVEINVAAGNLDYLDSIHGGVQEVTDSNHDQECKTHNQASSYFNNSRFTFIFLNSCFIFPSLNSLGSFFKILSSLGRGLVVSFSLIVTFYSIQ